MSGHSEKSPEEWRKQLSQEAFHVLRQGGTEPAFTGCYWDTKIEGRYVCAGCGQLLFESKAKFDSGTGWPSFWQAAAEGNVDTEPDHSLGMPRTEAKCGCCRSHLGHVFDDGPPPSGLRYCINSLALKLIMHPGPVA